MAIMHRTIHALVIIILVLVTVQPVFAADGLVVRRSKYTVAEAMDRLEAAIRQGGAMVFARIDLKVSAQRGELLRPHQIIMFGRGGAIQPFLSASSHSGIEFPQKILVFEDASGKTWVAYNTAEYAAQRHGISDAPGITQFVTGINRTVEGFADSIAD
jgi:uncharacterized protein (DUF302 family)